MILDKINYRTRGVIFFKSYGPFFINCDRARGVLPYGVSGREMVKIFNGEIEA